MKTFRTLFLLLLASSMVSLFAIVGIVVCIIFVYHIVIGG